MKKTALALILALALFGCNSNSKQRTLKPEDLVTQPKGPAPDFELVNVAGGTLKSADLKGKVTIVDFWATWCEPCKVEIPNYNKLFADRGAKDINLIGITVLSGKLAEVQPKVVELGLKYPVVMGDDDVQEKFGGLIGIPTTFIVDQNWKIYKKYMGLTSNKKEQIAKDIEKLLATEASTTED